MRLQPGRASECAGMVLQLRPGRRPRAQDLPNIVATSLRVQAGADSQPPRRSGQSPGYCRFPLQATSCGGDPGVRNQPV